MADARDDEVRRYLREVVAPRPLLSVADENRLFEEMRRPGPEAALARQALIDSNLRLVVSIAKRYGAHHLLDVIEEGNKGLERAVDSYTSDLPSKFKSFATLHIRDAIEARFGRSPGG